jgi:hypothetical protein
VLGRPNSSFQPSLAVGRSAAGQKGHATTNGEFQAGGRIRSVADLPEQIILMIPHIGAWRPYGRQKTSQPFCFGVQRNAGGFGSDICFFLNICQFSIRFGIVHMMKKSTVIIDYRQGIL